VSTCHESLPKDTNRAILFFGGAGYLLDRSLETGAWLLVLRLRLGVIAGFLGIAKLIRRP
jgi:F0F1-type ATP synthase assembly protein I